MFLLRMKTKRLDKVQIVTDRDWAIETARTFVGNHNPVDGCSTPVEEVDRGARFVIFRNTSFGIRMAWVLAPDPISQQFTLE